METGCRPPPEETAGRGLRQPLLGRAARLRRAPGGGPIADAY